QLTIAPIGSRVALNVLRDGRELAVALDVRPAPETVPRNETVLSGEGPLSGAKVVNLSPAVAQELGIEGPAHGVMIIEVGRGTVAARAGFEKGDRVLSVNDQKVDSVKALLAANAPSQRFWKITIERRGQVATRVFRF